MTEMEVRISVVPPLKYWFMITSFFQTTHNIELLSNGECMSKDDLQTLLIKMIRNVNSILCLSFDQLILCFSLRVESQKVKNQLRNLEKMITDLKVSVLNLLLSKAQL